MMWFATALILTLVGGCLGYSVECHEKIGKECGEDLYPTTFPTTSEELLTICSNLQTLARCMLNVLPTCSYEEFELSDAEDELESIRKIIKYLDENCIPESEIFQTISDNLECIKSSAGVAFKSCDRRLDILNEEKKESLFSYANRFLENENYPYEDTRICLYAVWDTTCPAVLSGKQCGSKVEEAALSILQRFEPNIEKCHEDILAELPTFLDFLHLALDEEEEVKEAFDKKK